jgi:hypothetical protein
MPFVATVTIDLSRRIGPDEAGPYDSEGYFSAADQVSCLPAKRGLQAPGVPGFCLLPADLFL